MTRHHRAVFFIAGCAVLLMILAGSASAGHTPAGTQCLDCHLLTGSTTDVWNQASKIKRTKLQPFITANGSPDFDGNHVPCLFCHDDQSGSRTDCVGVRQHLDGTRTTNPTHFRNSGTSYMTSTDATAASTAAGVLECSNCHDMTKALYVSTADEGIHGSGDIDRDLTGWEPETANAGYHFMLAVADANLGDSGDVGLCDQCHAAGGSQTAVAGNRSHSLTEPDGDQKTGDCYDCHEGHYSTADPDGEDHMYKDGTKPTSGGTLTEPVGGVAYSSCTAVCHDDTAFMASGHGKALSTNGNPLNYTCDSCHIVTAHKPGDTDPGVENLLTTSLGTIDNVTWNCNDCHGPASPQPAYHHAGNFNAGGSFDLSCSTCHNEHGDETSDGIGSNIYMVKEAIDGSGFTAYGGQSRLNISYLVKTEFFDATATERICETCHPTLVSNQHGTGKNGLDCTGCHSHTDPDDTYDPTSGDGTSGFNDPPADPAPTYNCGDCHIQPRTTGAHSAHITDNTDYTDCEACHTDPDGPGTLGYTSLTNYQGDFPNGTHGDGSLTLANFGYDNNATGGDYSDDTCSTNPCHGGLTASTYWGGDFLSCDACHDYSGSGPALSLSHADHITAGKTCATCHVEPPVEDTSHASDDGGTDGAILTDRAIADQDEAAIDFTGSPSSYTLNADNTCSAPTNNGLGCHATGLPDWDVSFTDCVSYCHADTTTAVVNPTTGLHNTTNLVDHDSTLTGGSGTGCEKCHDDTTAVSAGHQDGVLQDSAATAYDWNTANIAAGYVRATDDCAASCHTDLGTWNREWSGADDVAWVYTDDAATAAVCGNCHGSFFTGWGIVAATDHVNPDADNNPNTLDTDPARSGHTECTLCHGWDDGANNYQTGAKHENGFVTMNSDVSYNDVDGSCSLHCHGGLTLTMNTASGWTVDSVAGGAPACGSCHKDGVQTGLASATHTAHGATSADLISDGPWPDCVQCHPNVDYDLDHSGALQWANVTYSGGENGTCLTASCHNKDTGSDQSEAWDIATVLLCDDCHYYALSPTSAGNSANTTPLLNSHGAHFDAAGVTACIDCHADNTGDTDTMTHATGATLAAKSTPVSDNAGITAVGFDDIGNTCTTGLCHNPSGGAYVSNAWGTLNAGCTMCHSGTDPGTGSHNAHLATTTQADGGSIVCTSCHISNADPAHADCDGTVDFSGVTYATSSCGINICHNNGKNGTSRYNVENSPSVYTWGTAIGGVGSCTECHGDAAASQTTEAHAGHLAVTSPACSDCHMAATAATHAAGTVTLAGITYTGTPGSLDVTLNTFGTCTTTLCHNQGADGSEAWNSGLDLACDDCHYYALSPTSGDNTSHAASLTLSHGAHFDANKVCNDCHTNNIGDTATPLGHILGATLTSRALAAADDADVTRALMTWTDLGNTCADAGGGLALGCHATGSPVWGAGPLGCTNCHTDTTTAAVNPTTGLHNVSTALVHDDTLEEPDGLCVNCHDASSPSSLHWNAVLNNAGEGTWTWVNVTAYDRSTLPTYSGCQATCHDDGGDWFREWIGVFDAKPLATNSPGDAVCGNCHGDWVQGWHWDELNATTTDHTNPFAFEEPKDSMDQHNVCKSCHGWGHDNYNKTWGAAAPAHGDGAVTMNGPHSTSTGTEYDEIQHGCYKGCHPAPSEQFVMTDSGMTVNYGDFGAGSCDGCHGAGVNGGMTGATVNSYWPDSGVKTVDNPGSADDEGAHVIHMTRLASRVYGLTLQGLLDDADGDTKQKALCDYCHAATTNDDDHMTGDAAEVFDAVIASTPTDVAKHLGGTTDTDALYTSGTCTLTDCHNSKSTATTYDWYSGATSSCLMCHTVGGTDSLPLVIHANSGIHDGPPTVSGVAHDNSLGSGCAGCHTMPAITGGSTHINETAVIDSGSNTDRGLYGDYTDGTPGTCLGVTVGAAGCHDGAGDVGSWARKWSTDSYLTTNDPTAATSECGGCHGTFASGWTFGGGAHNAADGSVEHEYNWDGDAYLNEVPPNHGTCQTCHGWGNAAYSTTWSTGDHGNNNITLNGPAPSTGAGYNAATWACDNAGCHSNESDGHNLEDSGWTAAYGDFGAGACDGCHGYPPLKSGDPNAASYSNQKVEDYPNGGGAHGVNGHVPFGSVADNAWTPCLKCHPNTSHPDGGGTVTRTNVNVLVPDSYRANPTQPTAYNGDLGDSEVYMTCDNISCHFGLTPDWAMRAQCQPTATISTTYPAGAGTVAKQQNITITVTTSGIQPGTEQYNIYEPAPVDAWQGWTDLTTQWYTGDNSRTGVKIKTRGIDTTCGFLIESAENTFEVIDCNDTDPTTIVTDYPAAAGEVPESTDIYVGASVTVGDGMYVEYAIDETGTGSSWSAWTPAGTPWNSGTAKTGVLVKTRAEDPDCGFYYESAANTFDVGGAAYTPLDFSQGFENTGWATETTSGVGLVQTTGDNYDWTRQTGTTPSSTTGPSGGNTGSYYVFTETSSGTAGEWFGIDSVGLNTTTFGTDMQVSFYWHMYGSTMGTLRLQISKDGGAFTDLWSRSGQYQTSEAQAYESQVIDLSTELSGVTNYTLRFRGEHGGTFYSDMAIDDVHIWNGGGGPPTRTLSALHINDTFAPDTGEVTTDSIEVNGGSITYYADGEWTQPPSPENNTGAATWEWVSHVTNATLLDNVYTAGSTTGTDTIRATLAGVNSNQVDITVTPPRAITALHVNKTGGTDTSEVTTDSASPSGAIDFYAVGEYTQAPTPEDNTATATWEFVQNQSGASAFSNGNYVAGAGTGTDIIRAVVDSQLSNQVTITVSSAQPFGPVTYLAQADNTGATLATGITTNMSGTALTTPRWTTAVSSGATTTRTYVQTTSTSMVEGFTAVRNAVVDSNTTITDLEMSGRVRSYAVGTLFRLELIALASDGTVTSLYTSGDLTAPNNAGTSSDVTVGPLTGLSLSVPDGSKLGIRMYLNWVSSTATRGFSVDTGPVHTWFTVSGTSASGTAPAPPSSTGPVATACDTCHEFGPNDDYLDANNHPNAAQINTVFGFTPDKPSEYTYPAPGDHIKHGMGDAGTPASPANTDATGKCDICHGSGVPFYDNDHTDGSIQLASRNSGTGISGGYFLDADRKCYNVTCHGGASSVTPAWGVGTTNCGSCHGYAPDGTGGSTDHYSRTRTGDATPGSSTDANFFSAHSTCDTCHGVSGTGGDPATKTPATVIGTPVDTTPDGDVYVPASMHGTGAVQMNGAGGANPPYDQNAGYQEATTGCTQGCHMAPSENWRYNGTIKANTVELREFGSGDCAGCHDTGTGGAPVVTAASPHTDADGAGTTYAAGACENCHPFHSGGLTIPNNTTVGINYTSHSGIYLGGTATTGATQAEICWNCHDTNGVSEWGVNNNANTGGLPYHYGSLTTSDWTTATWSSGQGLNVSDPFYLKRGAIQSTHTANPSVTDAPLSGSAYGYTEAPNAVGDIRCAYCHDVHDLNQAAGDTVSGQPFLRGTWKGNPYYEDGPPRSNMTDWTSGGGTSNYGSVPRSSASATNTGLSSWPQPIGGFWIDQNSGNPNSGETLASTAGLCVLCHGSDVDNMDQVTGEGLWLGTNGHANAVIGGSGAASPNAYDICDTARRGSSTVESGDSIKSAYRDMGGYYETSDRLTTYRSHPNVGTEGYGLLPSVGGSTSRPAAFDSYEWGTSQAGSTPNIAAGTQQLVVYPMNNFQDKYHTFNCGKCHNPHASRRPKLMITNCLDTKLCDWDDTNSTTTSALGAPFTSTYASQFATAQNCHRLSDGTQGDTTRVRGEGWNKVTPWTPQ